MTYKVAVNATGFVTACGPDEDFFVPNVPSGGSIHGGITVLPEQPQRMWWWNGSGLEISSAAQAADVKAQCDAYLTSFRSDRERYLDRITGIAGRASRRGDPATAATCDTVAEGLLAMTQHSTVIAATDLTSLKAALKALYDALLVGVSNEIKGAFRKVDQ